MILAATLAACGWSLNSCNWLELSTINLTRIQFFPQSNDYKRATCFVYLIRTMKRCQNFITIGKPSFSRVMSRNKLLVFCFFLISCQSTIAQSKYIHKYRPIADSLSEVYSVPTSIILGIAILESGSGTSRNCKLLNNHFGIVGKNNLLKTKGVRTRYKQYINALASYVDFCQLMTKKKFYKKLKDSKDFNLWAEAISKAGYSEVPEYWRRKVLETIKKNNLSELN
jgi:hypothetical protein